MHQPSVAKFQASYAPSSVSLSSSRMASSATPEAGPLLPRREGIDKRTQRLSFMRFRGFLDVAICSLRHTSRQVAVSWECG